MELAIPLLPLVVKMFSPSFLRRMIDVVPWPTLKELRDIVDLTDETATELVRDRKAVISSGKLDLTDGGKDIMSLLMKSNASAESSLRLTDEEVVACTSMILFAATDTTSSWMKRLFQVLALYPDVQEKLRAEILAAPETVDHDELVALPYLDAVVREIFRLCLPTRVTGNVPRSLDRRRAPPQHAHYWRGWSSIDSIAVPKGTVINIAIAAANHNKRIWGEDALQFKPERWMNGKAEGVSTKMCGIYGNTMMFIGGHRSCIGFKFAQLEMRYQLRLIFCLALPKVVACVLLREFEFSKPDPRIQWRKASIIPAPNVENQPALPVLVEQLNEQ
ncbi:cytochrome P450 [Mycena capillaripes]|nr:cytochrome P450 [Mycena capillaripes]